MTSTEAFAEETWQWLYGPLESLKAECQDEPGVPWQTRKERFLSNLGLWDSSEHYVVESLVEMLEKQLDGDAAREAFLLGSEADAMIYALVYEYAEQNVVVAEPEAGVDLAGSDLATGAWPPSAETSFADSRSAPVENEQLQSTEVALGEAAQVVEQIVMPALTQALAAVPESAGLSDEDISQVLQEVLNDLGQPSAG